MWKRILPVLLTSCVLQAAASPDWITRLGGKVERNGAGDIVAVDLSATWVSDTEILDLAGLKKLERLNLSHTRISDEGLLHLRPARQIRDLNLLYTEQITDLGMNAIRDWSGLKRLNVRGTRIADGTLAIIGKLPHLEALDIANTGVTNAGLDHLGSLTELKHLSIGRSRFSDSAVAVLKLLTTLESLDLSGPRGAVRAQRSDSGPVPDALVQAIASLPELTVLKLGHNQVGTDELRTLAAALPKLEKLGLEECVRVDDQSLMVLAEWKSLRFLDLQGTKVKAAGIAELKKWRPNLVVLSGPFSDPAPAAPGK